MGGIFSRKQSESKAVWNALDPYGKASAVFMTDAHPALKKVFDKLKDVYKIQLRDNGLPIYGYALDSKKITGVDSNKITGVDSSTRFGKRKSRKNRRTRSRKTSRKTSRTTRRSRKIKN
jgi:hypothetical protein